MTSDKLTSTESSSSTPRYQPKNLQVKQRNRQKGVTLIELVVVIVILAISLYGVTTSLSGALSRSSDVVPQTRALALAQSYLDEILSKRFDEHSVPRGIPPCRTNCTDAVDLGLDGGETTRDEFDDVDDYDGLDEGFEQATELQDAEGNTRTGYDEFRVRVSVRYLDLAGGGVEENLATEPNDLTDVQDAKLITVTVSHASEPDGWKFSAYKANF
ncbi:MAG: type II secretion system protein [Pseudohongiella nitratireducens]|nr:type II secretion system protein [Pseudohongiella nitratireducens]MDF1622884.1 type II secretion system protein [Pseudohongiella nitratireducens]